MITYLYIPCIGYLQAGQYIQYGRYEVLREFTNRSERDLFNSKYRGFLIAVYVKRTTLIF